MSTGLHPRPQLTRPQWTDLCGEWQFAFDDGNRGLREQWQNATAPFDRTIQVPFPPESKRSGIGETGFHPVVWYRRTFALDDSQAAERLLLHFGAVDYCASVWVNEQLAGQHEGGHTPFTFDITHALDRSRAEQTVVVRAEDQPEDIAQPRGKQAWRARPNEIWYERTTGIWQPVWLEPVPETYIEALRLTPFAEESAVEIEVRLNQPAQGATLGLKVAFGESVLTSDQIEVNGARACRRIRLPLEQAGIQRHHVQWSPEHPHLFDLNVTLQNSGAGSDSVQSYFGLRSVSTAQGQFFLNNHPYYLRMVLEQGYYPDSHLAAPNAEALHEEVLWIKRLGFNAVRIHQKIEDPRFLYWCDREGLAVWGEMANAYEFSPTAVTRLVNEWQNAIERDFNHPCIVAWVPLNESWGVPHLRQDPAQQAFVRAITELTRALDPTRLVIGNDGWEHVAGDILGVHDYTQHGEQLTARYGSLEALQTTLRHRMPGHHVLIVDAQTVHGQPVMVTEFGGIAFDHQTKDGWGYGQAASSADLIEKYAELVNALYACPDIAGFCYTQLTDTVQEVNGLLMANRQPKADPATIAAITQHRPRK